METVKEILPIVLRVSLLLLVFALGLNATMADVTYLFKRPLRLFRAIVAIEIVVPLVAALLVAALPLAPLVKLGIVLMAVSPLPPVLPGKQLKLGGKSAYVYGLYVAVSLLAIVLVPLLLAILSAVFPADAWVAPAAVAQTLFVSVLLPLGVGMAVHRLSPQLAERAAPVVSKLASLLLLLAFLPVLIAMWPAMRALLGNGTALVSAAVVGAGLLAGHLLGGPDPEDRTTLAVASATRHPGIALLIATTAFPTENVVPAILLFVVVGVVAAIPYQVWSKKRAAGRLAAVEG